MITVQLEPDGPITEMDESLLLETRGTIDNDNELTTWVEYRLKSDPEGRIVHRSAHVRLKQAGVVAVSAVGSFI